MKLVLSASVGVAWIVAITFLSAQAPAQPAIGFLSINGQVYVVSGNRIAPLNQEVVFRVTPKGFVGFDGVPFTIPDGSMIALNGQLMAAPQQLRDANGNPVTLPASTAQGNVSGTQNGSGNNTTSGQIKPAVPNQAYIVPSPLPGIPKPPGITNPSPPVKSP
jgi:hypothetical protein